ncbi:MAG: hypothetical protein KF822_13130 [Steroidobacteraceae bacterium]|nr:hypothetical protein [Steroidobacteraceae bacterium]
MRPRSSRLFCALVIAASAALGAGCGTKAPPQTGFVGVGCYDHRNRIEPTIRSPGECRAASWVWRTEPWLPQAPKPEN